MFIFSQQSKLAKFKIKKKNELIVLFNVKMSLLWENHSSVNLLRFNKQIMRSRCRLVPEIL